MFSSGFPCGRPFILSRYGLAWQPGEVRPVRLALRRLVSPHLGTAVHAVLPDPALLALRTSPVLHN